MGEQAKQKIRQRLFAMRDLKYKEFQAKLMPTVDPDTVIGVRTPELRKYAGELAGTPAAEAFLEELPHAYYEENNLHGFLLEKVKDYDRAMAYVEGFLPYIDNWATCDMVCPKIFGKHLPELLEKIRVWIRSGETYTVRFGLGNAHALLPGRSLSAGVSGTGRRGPLGGILCKHDDCLVLCHGPGTSSTGRLCCTCRNAAWIPGPTTRPSRRPWKAGGSRRNRRRTCGPCG